MLASYHSFLLFSLIILIYLLSYGLALFKVFPMIKHKKIWNYALLISFLISGLLGLILAFNIDYNLSIAWYREILWLHVEAGIAMALIAFFHFFWHFQYYYNNQKKLNSKAQ